MAAYERIHHFDKLAYRRLMMLREAQCEVRRIQSALKRSEEKGEIYRGEWDERTDGVQCERGSLDSFVGT